MTILKRILAGIFALPVLVAGFVAMALIAFIVLMFDAAAYALNGPKHPRLRQRRR